MLEVIQALAVKNACYIANKPMTPKGIVLHSTGANNPNLKRYVDCPEELGINTYGNHWNTYHPGGADVAPHTYQKAKTGSGCAVCGGRQVCVHDFIGYDKNKQIRVAHILPYNVASWDCGGAYNYYPTGHIQIEICEDNLANKTYFEKAFAVAAEHCANLCKEYNLKPSTIVSHYEAAKKGKASNHGDCDHWLKKFGKDMDWFRAEVEKLLKKEENTIIDNKICYVQIGSEYSSMVKAAKPCVAIQALGINAKIKKVGTKYAVQVAAKNKADAEQIIKKLNNNGYSAVILLDDTKSSIDSKDTKKLEAGSKVKIKSGAVYGGLNSARGRAVPSTYTSPNRTYTVLRIQTNKNTEEALIKELYSWIATSYLTVV